MKFVLTVFLSLYLGFACTLPTAAAPEVNPNNVESFFDTAFAVQTKDHRIAGVVVSVVYRGEVLFAKGYGFADIENRKPADPEKSLFRIASITKPFVWTAIMQLHEQGKLNINDKVNDYLTVFQMPDTFDEPIRIRHLLSHTPGLEDQAIGMNARTAAETKSLERYLSENMPKQVRAPGEYAAYSNWGTSLAGYIVEQVSGQPWDVYVDKEILQPLEMDSTNTHKVMRDDFVERHAKSYVYSGGRFVGKPFEAMNDTPAGVMSTTAKDMTSFMIMHLSQGSFKGREVLSGDTSNLMHTPLFKAHESLPAMLHGFYRSDMNEQVIFGHGGDTNQFHSNLSLFPEHDLGLFVSFNSDPSDVARSNIVRSFVDYFFPSEYLREAPDAVSIPLAEYSGEYIPLRSNHSTIERLGTLVTSITIAENNGELQVNDGLWVPIAEDKFVSKYLDRTLVFLRGAANGVSHVVIGSPLGTYKKVTGFDAPANQKLLITIMVLIAVATVLGYGFRAFVPSHTVGLRSLPVFVAWLHGLSVLVLYAILVVVLTGDVEEFVLGVPRNMHLVLWVMNFNLIFGIYVIFTAVRNWGVGDGTTSMRIKFSFVALMALINFWVCWYFNILAYPLSAMQVISS